MFEIDKLFDPKPYNAPGLNIPEILGHEVNKVLGVTEFYRVCPYSETTRYYYAANGKTDVASGEEYDQYFSDWIPRTFDHSEPLEGFLRGFPLLDTPLGKVMAIHLHAQMDDIDASSIVVPLHEVEELYKYDDLYAELLAHQHNLIAGLERTSERYEIPLLRHKMTGAMITRLANESDIDRVIKELDLPPKLVLGEGLFSKNPTKPVKYIISPTLL